MSSAEADNAPLRCHVRGTSELIGEIDVVGALRLDTVPGLRKAVSKVLADGPETIVLDLNGVDAVEETLALVVFSTLGRLIADWAEGELILIAPHGPLQEILERAAPLFVRVFTTRSAGWHAAQQGTHRRRVHEQLTATPYAPRRARRLVDDVCTRWRLADTLRERAQTVATELVINAIDHTRNNIELTITVRRHVLRIEVSHSTRASCRDLSRC
jgi:anti-anti-sigma regulatory factor